MKCIKCETVLPDDANFCDQCGSSQVLVCKKCGNENRNTAKFCLYCGGQDLGPVKPSNSGW